MNSLKRYTCCIILHALIACCLVVCVGPSCAAVPENNLPDKQYISSQHDLVSVLLTFFNTDFNGARVYFESSCKSEQKPNLSMLGGLPLPRIGVRTIAGELPPLIMARQVFLGDNDVSTHTNDSGLVVVEIGHVNKSILETRIDSIRLNATQRYNPQLAIDKILDFATIQEAEERKQLFLLPVPMDMQVVSAAPGLPHLPAQIQSMTLDKILDLVASTFHGAVIFGVCDHWGVYDIRFVAGPVRGIKGADPFAQPGQ